MKFGENLRLLIQENNVTPEQLAEGLGISQSMLSSFTRCKWEPSFKMLKHIAAYFHVSTDYLLDHRSAPSQAEHRMEDELLQAFSEMPPEQQRIFLAQGKAAARVCMTR